MKKQRNEKNEKTEVGQKKWGKQRKAGKVQHTYLLGKLEDTQAKNHEIVFTRFYKKVELHD